MDISGWGELYRVIFQLDLSKKCWRWQNPYQNKWKQRYVTEKMWNFYSRFHFLLLPFAIFNTKYFLARTSWKTPCRTPLLIYWKSEELADERSLVVTWGKGIFLLGMAGFSDTTLLSKNTRLYNLMRWDVFNLSSGILPMLMLGGNAIGPGSFRTF